MLIEVGQKLVAYTHGGVRPAEITQVLEGTDFRPEKRWVKVEFFDKRSGTEGRDFTYWQVEDCFKAGRVLPLNATEDQLTALWNILK